MTDASGARRRDSKAAPRPWTRSLQPRGASSRDRCRGPVSTIPSKPESGARVCRAAVDQRRLERARRERDRRIAEHGARLLAVPRQQASGTDGLGAWPMKPRFDR